MMPSRILVKWTVEGALFGYCVLHPLVMLISYFMSLIYSSHDHPISKNFAAAILGFFSIGMLPWSLAFAIFVALIFLYYRTHSEILS
jgi:hypothetical protein